jgi:hypothetical protein
MSSTLRLALVALGSIVLAAPCVLGCGASPAEDVDADEITGDHEDSVGTVSFEQNQFAVTFTNSDGQWVVYTGCFGPAARGGENVTVGPGYIARVVLNKDTPAGRTVVDDEGPHKNASGTVIGFTGIGHAGLGGYSWHHSRGHAPFDFDFNSAWEISGRLCAEDNGGFGVSGAHVVDGPRLTDDGAATLTIDVDFTDGWTKSGPITTVRYIHRVESTVVKMWAMVVEHCDGGNCGGVDAPGPAYIGEPKFVSAVNGGGYRRLVMFNSSNKIAQNSGSKNASCVWTGSSPTKSTGQCDGDGRVRARFDYGSLASGTDGDCNAGSHQCLNTVMLAYPVDADGSLTPGRQPALWEDAPFGLDAWARASASREQASSVDSPFGDAQWSCHGGSPGSERLRRWELVGMATDAQHRYTSAAMFFHAWESGTGAYDCEPLSRRFGPEGERFAIYAQFSFNDGWKLP